MKRALWLLLLLPGLCVFAFGDERSTCDNSWHCVAPAPVVEEAPAMVDVEDDAPAIAHHMASVLLDAVPPGDR